MCCLHSDIAVLSLLVLSLSYQEVRITYYSNHRVLLVINISTAWKSLFYIFIILLLYCLKKLQNKQMNTVITVYVALHKNFVHWECTCRARQHLTLPWNRTCLSCLTIIACSFTSQRFVVTIRIPQRRVLIELGFSRPCDKAFRICLCLVWSGCA